MLSMIMISLDPVVTAENPVSTDEQLGECSLVFYCLTFFYKMEWKTNGIEIQIHANATWLVMRTMRYPQCIRWIVPTFFIQFGTKRLLRRSFSLLGGCFETIINKNGMLRCGIIQHNFTLCSIRCGKEEITNLYDFLLDNGYVFIQHTH